MPVQPTKKNVVPDADVDTLLAKELDKLAETTPFSREEELETIMRFKQHEAPEDFQNLWNIHQPLIYRAGERYLRSTTLPKTAVRSSLKNSYLSALRSYDPSKGRRSLAP